MQIIQPNIASATSAKLRIPAIVSSVLVVPFVTLELVNRRGFHDSFAIPLFGFLWLLSFSFLVVLMPIIRSLPGETRNSPNPLGVLARIGLLVLIAWLWVGLVMDQMPCFLGVPKCD